MNQDEYNKRIWNPRRAHRTASLDECTSIQLHTFIDLSFKRLSRLRTLPMHLSFTRKEITMVEADIADAKDILNSRQKEGNL